MVAKTPAGTAYDYYNPEVTEEAYSLLLIVRE
jgi:hypothetical protein